MATLDNVSFVLMKNVKNAEKLLTLKTDIIIEQKESNIILLKDI